MGSIKLKDLISEKVDRSTIHGKGVVVATNYRLKNDTKGWWKMSTIADEDFYITLKRGTKVDVVLQHDDGMYSMYIKELSGKDFMKDKNNIYYNSTARWESDKLNK